RSRLISRDGISPAERGAIVVSATQVGPIRRWSTLRARGPDRAGPWPSLTTAAVERAKGRRSNLVPVSVLPAEEVLAWCSAMLDTDRMGFIAREPLQSLRNHFQTTAAR